MDGWTHDPEQSEYSKERKAAREWIEKYEIKGGPAYHALLELAFSAGARYERKKSE